MNSNSTPNTNIAFVVRHMQHVFVLLFVCCFFLFFFYFFFSFTSFMKPEASIRVSITYWTNEYSNKFVAYAMAWVCSCCHCLLNVKSAPVSCNLIESGQTRVEQQKEPTEYIHAGLLFLQKKDITSIMARKRVETTKNQKNRTKWSKDMEKMKEKTILVPHTKVNCIEKSMSNNVPTVILSSKPTESNSSLYLPRLLWKSKIIHKQHLRIEKIIHSANSIRRFKSWLAWFRPPFYL